MKNILFMVSSALAFLCLSSPLTYGGNGGAQNNPPSEGIRERRISIKGMRYLDTSEIYGALGVKTASWFEFWKKKKYGIAEALIPSIGDTLRGFLDSKGYYDAVYSVKNTRDEIEITIDEKTPVTVSDINISSDFPIKEYIVLTKRRSV